MQTKNEDLFDRIFECINDDDEIEDVLRVLIAVSCAAMKTMDISGYKIDMPDGHTINLEIIEPKEKIVWL